jgi:hypothetical protein
MNCQYELSILKFTKMAANKVVYLPGGQKYAFMFYLNLHRSKQFGSTSHLQTLDQLIVVYPKYYQKKLFLHLIGIDPKRRVSAI